MSTWAIGDVHGCYRTLRALLARPEVEAAERFWFVGDLVNRGPRSLETLRFVAGLGERATTVLGNHDLHFLARAAGVAAERRRDDLDALLDAPDCDELAGWLLERPLVVSDDERLLVHAGVLPAWDRAAVVRRARRVESALRAQPAGYLESYRPGLPEEKLPEGVDAEVRDDLRVLTLLRTVDDAGRPAYDFTGPLAELPAGRRPWFAAPGRATREPTIVCGHWAALGLHRGDGVVALDTGCAWGGALTACRLEDGRIEQQENLDGGRA
jgi:bis(5'-nucleosyl)-tetraphosphatase (symmetrical)